MKKVLITRKLLRPNEDRISKLWEAKLNLNDEVYSQTKLIELSKYLISPFKIFNSQFNQIKILIVKI